MNVDYAFEGLALDVTVLEALLKRNRNNHGRTIYYRRISMALQAMKRHQLLEFSSKLETLQQECKLYQQQLKKRKSIKMKKKKLREERWGEKVQKDDDEEDVSKQKVSLQSDFTSFEATLLEKFPEILSRIQHASVPLFTEINRGFFLPFCTVAIGALGRIRALIQKIGCWGLTVLKEIQVENEEGSSSSLFKFSQQKFEIAMNQHYIEPNESKEDRKICQRKQMELTLSSLGIAHDILSSHQHQQQHEKSTESVGEAGINDDGVNQNQEEPEVEAEGMEFDDDKGSGDSPQKQEEIATSFDDDVGESVGASASLVALNDNSTSNKPVETLFDDTAATPIDRNLGLVQEFKKKKKPDKKNGHQTTAAGKKKEKKRKKSGDAGNDDEDRKSSKKKKKKKTKGAGADYFDELFS